MPDYFETMGIPLLAGRSFSRHDDRGATPVALISEAFRRQHLSGRDPIGARIELGQASVVQVIGVVGSIRAEGPDRSPVPEIYLPYAGNVTGSMSVVVRHDNDPAQLVSTIRARIREIDRLLPVEEIATMPVVIGESYAGPHIFVWMCAGFASIAALIAAAGMYSVMSYYVSRRTHEMGIRIALGARRQHIYGLILGYAAVLVLAGAAIGIPCGIALSHAMKGLLFGISPFDPLVYVGLGVFLVSATLAACCGPVRRAVRIDPAACIRES